MQNIKDKFLDLWVTQIWEGWYRNLPIASSSESGLPSRKGSQKQCKLADSTKLTFKREKIQMGLNKSQHIYQINSSVAKQQEPKTA